MVTRVPFSTLCVLSLTLPLLGQCGNLWLFVNSRQSQQLAFLENNPSTTSDADQKKSEITTSKKRWDCALSIGMGYRHDQLKSRFTPDDSNLQQVKFRYRDIDSVMAVLRIDARYRNLLFNLEGDYSPMVDATLSAPFNVDPTVGNTFHFRFNKLTGYEADAMASIGYRLLFLSGYSSRAAIIFQLGYRYSHQAYETDKQSRVSNETSFISILQDQAPLHVEWFGPFLEARLSLSYRDKLTFQPFYQYHFLDYRAQRKEAQKVYFYDGGLVSPSDFLVKFVTRSNNARGQLGGFDFYYQQQRGLRIGLKGTYLSFKSNDTRTRTKIKEVSLNTNPPTRTTSHPRYHSHANWDSYSIAVYSGYNF